MKKTKPEAPLDFDLTADFDPDFLPINIREAKKEREAEEINDNS